MADTSFAADPAIEQLVTRLEQAGLVLVARQRTPWQTWMGDFLEALERHNGNVKLASEEVEVSRRTVYNYRDTCQPFRQRWGETLSAVAARKNRRGK